MADAPDAAGDALDDVIGDAGLPDVGPVEPCPPEEPDRSCIRGGWFTLHQWGSFADQSEPTRSVFLDSFLIDTVEVNVSELESSGGAPPSCDGVTDEVVCDLCELDGINVFEMSAPTLASRPVTCITREDAEAFCASRGGRLPSAFEWFRAFMGESGRSFPWGETPTHLDTEFWGSHVPNPLAPTAGGSTYDVGALEANTTPDGVRDMAGNVSELVAGCPEDVTLSTSPLVRPTPGVGCARGVLVAGSNWMTAVDVRGRNAAAAAASLFIVDFDDVTYAGESSHPLATANALGITSGSSEGRSWRIGFRCAYDI